MTDKIIYGKTHPRPIIENNKTKCSGEENEIKCVKEDDENTRLFGGEIKPVAGPGGVGGVRFVPRKKPGSTPVNAELCLDKQKIQYHKYSVWVFFLQTTLENPQKAKTLLIIFVYLRDESLFIP